MASSAAEGNPRHSSAGGRSGGSRWWLWLIIVAVLAYAGWRMFGRSAADTQAQTPGAGRGRGPLTDVPVRLATATQGDIGVYVSALGTVTPVNTVAVTSRVQGQIMQIFYREGQMVRKGDPLLEIDTRPYQAALTQAEGQLAHDQAQLTQAHIDFERYKAAFARNAIAKQQVDDQEQAVRQFEGTVKNDEGAVDNAKVNLAYCHIASPIDGRVGLRLVDVGNIVQANSSTSLVVVTQLQPITVIFNVAEDYLGAIQSQLHRGKTLEVDVYDRAIEKQLAKGRLLTVDNQIDVSTGTVKLRAEFTNADSALFPNQFVNARLLVDTLHDVTLLPASAIQRNSQGAYVYVIKPDQTATIRQIKEGTTDGNTTSVQGVNAGETVATDGFDKLQDGVKVRARGAGSSGGQAASAGAAGDSKGVSKEAATK